MLNDTTVGIGSTGPNTWVPTTEGNTGFVERTLGIPHALGLAGRVAWTLTAAHGNCVFIHGHLGGGSAGMTGFFCSWPPITFVHWVPVITIFASTTQIQSLALVIN